MHPQDIIVLVPTHVEGLSLVEMFDKKSKIKVNHVFDPNHHNENKSNKNKMSFWMGDSRLKMSTIHSFKGWESINVIILTPAKEENYSELDNILYTSITRTRANMFVFNRLEKYNEYGEGWPKYWLSQNV